MSQGKPLQPDSTASQAPAVIEVTGTCSVEEMWRQLESAAKFRGCVEDPDV